MTSSRERTVLFADLRGSTSLYESLGNTQAAEIITRTVGMLAQVVSAQQGRVVKTLGDGLMAIFDKPVRSARAARDMQDSIARIMANANTGAASLKLRVALAHGEIVEVDGDCFGDAVNVAARLLEHAGDNEVLITEAVHAQLSRLDRQRFRCLDRLHLRGRAEPCKVFMLETWADDAPVSTLFSDFTDTPSAECLRLTVGGAPQTFTPQQTPVVLGRSPESTLCIDDTRVSRLHARIEWHGGNFHLDDQSSNGSFVRFANEAETIALRRGRCMLHGRGVIGLGAPPDEPGAACLHFEIFSYATP
jgi:class 3 adenylate cyclase